MIIVVNVSRMIFYSGEIPSGRSQVTTRNIIITDEIQLTLVTREQRNTVVRESLLESTLLIDRR